KTMAKSPINLLLDEDNKQHKEKRKRTDVIKYSKQGAEREISLRCLDHQICDVTQPEVTDGVRLTNIDKLKDKIHEYFELGRSSFARQIFYNCKSYIANADAHDLEPFSKEGWKSFFGVNGYIWGLVNDAKIQHTHSFMYDNNQSVGISEKTAAGMKRIIKNIFSSLKLDVFEWNKGLKEFSTAGKRKVPPDPFTQRQFSRELSPDV
ncbi:MAG: hypothetical protein WBM99_17100, partial [Psychromonas sp.]